MLDSFAKTVCRNFVRNLRRDEPVRDSHLADKQAADILEKIGHGDTYLSDFFVLYVDGHRVLSYDGKYYHVVSNTGLHHYMSPWRSFRTKDEAVASLLDAGASESQDAQG